MKTVSELLKDADPLAWEPMWSPQERMAVEERVLAALPTASAMWWRHSGLTWAATFVLVATAAIVLRLSSSPLHAAVRFEVRLAEESPAPDLRPMTIDQSGRTIYVHDETIVGNSDIAEAYVVPGDSSSTLGIEVVFNEEGAEKMRLATSTHLGRPIAIFVDDEIVALPVVRSPIGDKAYLSGNFSRDEAERLAEGMIGQ